MRKVSHCGLLITGFTSLVYSYCEIFVSVYIAISLCVCLPTVPHVCCYGHFKVATCSLLCSHHCDCFGMEAWEHSKLSCSHTVHQYPACPSHPSAPWEGKNCVGTSQTGPVKIVSEHPKSSHPQYSIPLHHRKGWTLLSHPQLSILYRKGWTHCPTHSTPGRDGHYCPTHSTPSTTGRDGHYCPTHSSPSFTGKD